VSFSGGRGARCLAAAAILVLATAGPAPGLPADAAVRETVQGGVAWAEIGAKTLDVVVLRPLGAAATVAGFAFFLVSSPLTAASQRIGTSWDTFVLAPVDYTFERPLGDF
jgi:hypothetical protein